jgi:hypothetical protein
MLETRRSTLSGASPLLLSGLLTFAATGWLGTGGIQSLPAQAVGCERGDSVRVPQVSGRCVGPISVDSTLGWLRTKFPNAKQVPFSIEDPGRGGYAGLMFHISGLEVLATQFRRTISWDRPASVWMITGSAAVLPSGVPITATWAQLRRVYPGRVFCLNPELGIRVEFCDTPGLILNLEIDPPDDSIVRETRKTEDIPDTATISGILIDRGWPSPCSDSARPGRHP